MRKQKIEEYKMEYLDPATSAKRRDELRDILTRLDQMDDALDMEKVFSELGKIHTPHPSRAMTTNFFTMLKDYERNISEENSFWEKLLTWFQSFDRQKITLRFAFSLLLVFTGWIIGYRFTPNPAYDRQVQYMSTEIKEMKSMLTQAMLNQPSPSQRIKTINQIGEQMEIDDQIVTALINILNEDPNVNVRLIAVETLAKLSDNSRVRAGLVASISKQDSPLLQLALADIMTILNETKAVEHFKLLLRRKDLNDVVRSKITQSIEILI